MSQALSSARQHLLVIRNPRSGRRGGALLDHVSAELRSAGTRLTIVSADTYDSIRGQALRARESGDHDAVVVAGGDGSIRAAAAALVGGTLPLGVIALGTGNVLATELALPRQSGAISRMLRQGHTITVSCGSVMGEPFLLMAGAGFDARIVSRLDTRVKRYLGQLAYAGPILAETLQPPRPFTALIDGRSFSCTWLVVANAKHYGSSFVIAEGRDIGAPDFQAVVVTAPTRLRFLQVLLALARGRIGDNKDVAVVACRNVELPDATRVPCQIDGDLINARTLRITSDKLPLQVIVPENLQQRHLPSAQEPHGFDQRGGLEVPQHERHRRDRGG